MAAAEPTAARGSKGSGSSSNAPASIFEKSSTSPITPSRVWLASWINPAWRASCSDRDFDVFSTPVKPRMAVSGVRSSWVMFARKSVLAAAAAWAPARASFSSSSSALRWETSRDTPNRRPDPSLSRVKVVSAQTTEPSLANTRYSMVRGPVSSVVPSMKVCTGSESSGCM